ncbi:hypothetical protein JQ604_37910 [Bradyrhizobium jicamae]|uniref:hypothetical protein n=1 Tax=Bradyrhizobium jicamae TaxID=280332 RepID=UPI001BA6270E|nr:hypothetical protein [Bradyrhizobium jicamae]MBR0757989.1 hypothetical protein [Bradyrhizobium jicamae]
MNATDDTLSASAPNETTLSLASDSAVLLATRLGGLNLLGEGNAMVPWGTSPSIVAFKSAISTGEALLPWAYQRAYVRALHDNMERLLAATTISGNTDPAETLLGAIYQHAIDSPLGAQLRRFNVVISHFFRAFLANHKRQRLGLSTVQRLPPLATFSHSGLRGPFTFPSDAVTNLVGSNVGIVSLPSTYSNHPVIWAALAHETGGHDIVHAVPGLLADLTALPLTLVPSFMAALGVDASTAQMLGLLWRYWIEEASADACATLNMGPSFALNFIALLAAFHGETGPAPAPGLWTSAVAQPGESLDTHPVDALRVGLAIGAIGSLHGLNVAAKQSYITLLSEVAAKLSGSATTASVRGEVPVPGSGSIRLHLTLPIALMQYAAAIVGSAIVKTPFASLNGFSLQQVETWDSFDEQAAWRFARALKDGAAVLPAVYSAHVLAGATLVLYHDPDRYDDVTAQVMGALDEQVQRDRFWSVAQRARTRSYTVPVMPAA